MNIKKKIPAFFAGVASTSLLLYYDEIKNTNFYKLKYLLYLIKLHKSGKLNV